jgi:ribonuclease HI
MSTKKRVAIYTDGATIGNGFNDCVGTSAFVVYENNIEIESRSIAAKHTTINRCELAAVIGALEFSMEHNIEPIIYCDSQYVVQGINSYSLPYKAAHKTKEVKNDDLWAYIYELQENVNFDIIWVRGHVGIKGNERADELCQIEMTKSFPDADINVIKKSGYLNNL